MKTLKKRIGSLPMALIGLVVVAVLVYFVFIPKPPSKPDESWIRIQTERVLRIGVDPSSPPFVVDDGKGNLSGFDVALANELAKRWNVKVQYVYTGYDGLYDALAGNQFDMILSALPYNPFKTQDVNFSRAYFNAGPVLIVRGDDTTTTNLESLAGRAVAVELGSSGDAVARKWERRLNLQVTRESTTQDALRALQRGQVTAAITDPISFYDFQRAEADTGAASWRIVGEPLADESYVIAVRKEAPELLRQINEVIDSMRRDKSLEQLQKENF